MEVVLQNTSSSDINRFAFELQKNTDYYTKIMYNCLVLHFAVWQDEPNVYSMGIWVAPTLSE
jgi:hypothetical protein